MKTTRFLLAAAGMLLITFSCKKSNNENPKEDDTAKNYTLDVKAAAILETEQFANEMELVLRHVPENLTQYPNGGSFLNCATITRTNILSGKEITISFNQATVCADGKTRSGAMVIEYNTTNHDTMVSLQNYKVNNVEFKGQFIIGYENLQSVAKVTLTAINTSIKKDAQNEIAFSYSKKSTIKTGANTIDPTDDVMEYADASYFLTAKIAGTNMLIKGTALNVSQLKNNCNTPKYLPSAGQVKVEYSVSGTSTDPNNPLTGTLYLTFGDGTCGSKPFVQKKL